MTSGLGDRRLREAIRKLQGARLFVLGDLMLDKFIWGRVDRISPEAPIPVVRVTKESAYPGGAANVGRNLVDFGISAVMSGLVGRDANGSELAKLLKSSKLWGPTVFEVPGFQTIVKARVVARQQQVVRVDREDPAYRVPERLVKKWSTLLEKEIARCDAVILEDYGKGFLTQEMVSTVIGLCQKHKKIVTVDPNAGNPLDWRGVTAVKPNRHEAAAVLGRPLPEDEAGLQKAGEELCAKWDVDMVLLTLGEGGMMLLNPPRKPYHTPTRALEVYDVSGAGDTAIAFFTASLAVGLKPWEAAEIANHASGVVIGKLGTATLNQEELWKSFHRDGR